MISNLNRSCLRRTLDSLQTLRRLFQNDICVLMVITSNTGKLATVYCDFLSLNHVVSRRGDAVLGLLAIVIGHQLPRISCEARDARGGSAEGRGHRVVLWAISSAAGVVNRTLPGSLGFHAARK